MTLRERIADWISGGALSLAIDDKLYWIELAAQRREALLDITAMATPGANGTVKRMAARAREALK